MYLIYAYVLNILNKMDYNCIYLSCTLLCPRERERERESVFVFNCYVYIVTTYILYQYTPSDKECFLLPI